MAFIHSHPSRRPGRMSTATSQGGGNLTDTAMVYCFHITSDHLMSRHQSPTFS